MAANTGNTTKTISGLAASLLQRPALTSTTAPSGQFPVTVITGVPTTHTASTSTTTSGISATKTSGATIVSVPDLTTTRAVRKQANPIKQTNIPLVSSAVANTPPKTKYNPLPPPLIPTNPSASVEHSYASKPVVTNGGIQAEKKKSETTTGKSSSESSSEDTSSDSSASSAEDTDKEELQKQVKKGVPVVDSETPGPSGLVRRGRPRGRPRLTTSTPQPTKTTNPAAKEDKSRTTPRKKSGRVPKPTPVFSPDLAGGKAALPKRRGRGCGGCPGCLRDDCGKCNYCKDKTKFGGPGRKKQRCILRVCSNFVKAMHGRGRMASNPTVASPAGQSEVAVIPVTKLASSSKVAEVIEQLKQNLTSSIPPVIDKDSVDPAVATTMVAPQTTSFIIAKPEQLKATPSAMANAAASETKIVGPVTPPSLSSKEVAPTTQAQSTTASTSTSTTVTETKTSEIALRTRRKQQQQQQQQQQQPPPQKVKEEPVVADGEKVKCIVCGKERKRSLMRSPRFCTQRCINQWSEQNSEEVDTAETSEPMEVDKQPEQPKRLPRALKNLQIDMAWNRTTKSGDVRSSSFTSTVTPTPKPTTTTTPTHTATTAANKRPTASTGVQPTPSKKTAKETESVAGTKRASQQQPPAQKKMKEDPPKSVSFNLTIPTSTVDPISAPPLSRTVPPPSISIVPLDQLTALGTALFTQQQQRTKKEETVMTKTNSKIPSGLPVDVRSWTIPQVVKFFESTSDCKDYAAVFREQEVDGTALLLLTHESLVKCLGIKLGRALKIMVHVEELQKLYT